MVINPPININVKKAIMPVAGRGTRFLPLSQAMAKELWPLVDKPTLQYILEEAIASGIKEFIFINRPDKEMLLDYFREHFKPSNVSFSQVIQKEQLGDGHAVLQAKKSAGKEPCLVLFGDDVVEAKVPASQQLLQAFNQCQKPLVALCRAPKEKISSYGAVKVEKAGPRLYKIKGIVEKPEKNQAPSNLAVVGKYIIDSQVFDFLENTPCKAKGEIRLAGAFNEMIKEGLDVYGYELEGKWLECGNKLAYLKSNFYLSLKHPQFKKELKKFLKEEKL